MGDVMFECLRDPAGCIIHSFTDYLLGWAMALPWWAWGAIALLVVGGVYSRFGWPGLLALATAGGFALGRWDERRRWKANVESVAPTRAAPKKLAEQRNAQLRDGPLRRLIRRWRQK